MSGPGYERALAAFRLKRWDLACKELGSELASNPQNSQALSLLAACNLNLGQIQKAIEQAKESIKVNPRVAYPHYIAALSYQRAKQTFEAELAIEDALRLEPDNPDYMAVLAAIRIQTNQRGKGLQLLDQALSIDPTHHYALRQKYYLYVAEKKRREADRVRLQILEHYPQDAEMHANSGWRKLENKKEREHALADFEEALRIDPQASTYVDGLIEARFHDKSADTGFAKFLTSARFRIAALLLSLLSCVLAAFAVNMGETGAYISLALVGCALILIVLLIWGEPISRCVYYCSIYLSREKREALPTNSRTKVTSYAYGALFGLACVVLGFCCGMRHVTFDIIPSWLAKDWLDIVGDRYLIAIPILFIGATAGIFIALPMVARTHIKGRRRDTRYFQMSYLAICCVIVFGLFWFVSHYHPGGWFIWVLLPLELILLMLPSSPFLREWVKSEIRKDQTELPDQT